MRWKKKNARAYSTPIFFCWDLGIRIDCSRSCTYNYRYTTNTTSHITGIPGIHRPIQRQIIKSPTIADSFKKRRLLILLIILYNTHDMYFICRIDTNTKLELMLFLFVFFVKEIPGAKLERIFPSVSRTIDPRHSLRSITALPAASEYINI